MYSIKTVMDDIPMHNSTLDENYRSCQAVDKTTGELCGETESLSILNEFQRLYESRIEKVDREISGEFERASTKLHIMEEWIRELGEQNIMLAHTVEDLEQAACNRVKLLEEKLQLSSSVVSKNITRSSITEQAISVLSNRVTVLEREEEYLQEKIGFLKNDIKALLELIRRARTENHWNMDGLSFFEIHPDEDIPPTLDCTCDQEETNDENIQSLKLQIEQLQEHERKMIEYQTELEDKVAYLSSELVSKDEIIKQQSCNIENFYPNVTKHSNFVDQESDKILKSYSDDSSNIALREKREIRDLSSEKVSIVQELKKQLKNTQEAIVSITREKDLELSAVKDELKEKCNEIESLTETIKTLREECRTTEETLKAEIREKDDIISDLEKKVIELEKSCSEAYLKTDFEKDIITKMSKKMQRWTRKKGLSNTEESFVSIKDKLLINQDKAKLLMEEQKQEILNLKAEVENLLRDGLHKKQECCGNIDIFNANEIIENFMTNVTHAIDMYLKPECHEKLCKWKPQVLSLQGQITELQNQLDSFHERQKEVSENSIHDEVDFMQVSKKELASTYPNGTNGGLIPYGKQYQRCIMTGRELLQSLENTMESTKNALQELEHDLMSAVNGNANNYHLDTTPSVAKLRLLWMEKLSKCMNQLNTWPSQISKLWDNMNSKDKLLENMDVIIQVQKDSTAMIQTELTEVQDKLQEKINMQDHTLKQYEMEKNELLKQNELQVQTIGHLQNAVVEAKKNLDHLSRKAVSDLQEKEDIIRTCQMCSDEIQFQCNKYFTEAAELYYLLNVQRDAISTLQDRIRSMEYEKIVVTTSLHNIFYAMINKVKEELERRVVEFNKLQQKVKVLVETNIALEDKYLRAKKSCEDAEEKLQELRIEVKSYENKDCQCKEMMEESKDTVEMKTLQSEITLLVKENDDQKRQIQKWKCEFDTILEVLQIELNDENQLQQIACEMQRILNAECSLQSENKHLKWDLQSKVAESKDLKKSLEEVKEHAKKYETELNSVNEAAGTLWQRIGSLRTLLTEKSDELAKWRSNYEVLKNENVILKKEKKMIENKAKDDIYQLRQKLNQSILERESLKDENHKISQDFKRNQEELAEVARRDVELEELLIKMEEDYTSKLVSVQQQVSNLESLVDRLSEDLENAEKKCTLKDTKLFEFQEICKTYVDNIDAMKSHLEHERKSLTVMEQTNRSLEQKLETYIEQNYGLMEEKSALERNNSKILTELEEMHKSLLELKQKCQLKDESLANISAELTQTAVSRTELCKESQYVVSCIRIWMEEQKQYTDTLSLNLRTKQQQLSQLIFEKKGFLANIRELQRINHALSQKLTRTQRIGRLAKYIPGGDYINLSCSSHNTLSHNHLGCKKSTNGALKFGRRSWSRRDFSWISQMACLTDKHGNKNSCNHERCCKTDDETETALEENRDYGYQSCASK